jgi:hypothetical protein
VGDIEFFGKFCFIERTLYSLEILCLRKIPTINSGYVILRTESKLLYFESRFKIAEILILTIARFSVIKVAVRVRQDFRHYLPSPSVGVPFWNCHRIKFRRKNV